jgi:hypothetical protein
VGLAVNACIILAQHLPEPHATVERMVANCWVTNNVKPLPPQAVANGQALHRWRPSQNRPPRMTASAIHRQFSTDSHRRQHSLPPDQQDMLRPVFRRYTVASYVNSFDRFTGQQFIVESETRPVGNGEQVVLTRITPPSGDGHELDYVMRNTDSGWRSVDVLADGAISRVAVQQSDFRRLLSRGGAPALAESLGTKSLVLSDPTSAPFRIQ